MASDNPQDTPNKKTISDLKKYTLLSIAAILLIGAYFIGQSIEINQTYDNKAYAQNDIKKPVDIPKGKYIQGNYKKRFASDQILGDTSKNPKITLVEYGSLTCPHCAHFHKSALTSIEKDYIHTQKIQYIYRDYPLDGGALKAALLARCDLSKRSAFINLLYKKQTEWTKVNSLQALEKNLLILAKLGGLSSDKVTKCLADKETIHDIISVQKQSNTLFNIEATPTILINDQKFTGGMEKDALKAVLDKLLIQ